MLRLPKCYHYHRELPDFVVPFKHLSAKIYAAICDAINEFVDDHTAARICRWVKGFCIRCCDRKKTET
ncbi:DUF6431 domain-containing protein [Ruminococcus albus]|uniref:DUF6431 domain-containing protein n=1 Tax=Ruminococcus albus TaxID=1264 RepID=UPI003AF36F50